MNKADRVLILYDRLLRGERIKKRLFMDEFSVGRRSFDRYIEAVRLMLSETFAPHELLYDAADHSYYLSGEKSEKLRGMNVLPLLLLLFDSKAFGESDITSILQGLSANLSSDERGHLRKAAIRMSKDHGPIPSSPSLLKMLWDLNLVIDRQQKIRLFLADGKETESALPVRLSFADGNIALQAKTEKDAMQEYSLSSIRYFTPL